MALKTDYMSSIRIEDKLLLNITHQFLYWIKNMHIKRKKSAIVPNVNTTIGFIIQNTSTKEGLAVKNATINTPTTIYVSIFTLKSNTYPITN